MCNITSGIGEGARSERGARECGEGASPGINRSLVAVRSLPSLAAMAVRVVTNYRPRLRGLRLQSS